MAQTEPIRWEVKPLGKDNNMVERSTIEPGDVYDTADPPHSHSIAIIYNSIAIETERRAGGGDVIITGAVAHGEIEAAGVASVRYAQALTAAEQESIACIMYDAATRALQNLRGAINDSPIGVPQVQQGGDDEGEK